MNLLILPDPGRSFNTVRPEASIFTSLARRGHNITIMTDADGAYVETYRNEGVTVIPLSSKHKLNWSGIAKIRQIIKQQNIDLVYATKSRTIPNAVFGSLGTNAKLVAYRGTTGGLYRTDLTNYLSILNPRVDGVICVSKAVEKHVKQQVIDKKAVETIYKGHDLQWYQQEATELSSINTNANNLNILCIGSERPHKGTFVVLDALAKLKHLTQLKLILVGDKLDTQIFDDYIKNHGIEHMVIRTGFRSDVPAIAKACDFTILPSKREGLPRIVLESLAVGTPVVTSSNEGALEIIKHDENGLVFPIGNSDALAQCITKLATDEALLKTLANNAQEAIKTTFSHQSTVDQYELFFEKLTSN